MSPKPGTSFRFDDETRALLELLAAHHGASQTDVIRQAVRLLARREGITVEAAMKAAAKRDRER